MATMLLSDAVRAVALTNPSAVGNRPLYTAALKQIRNGAMPVERTGRNYQVDEKYLPLLAMLLRLAPREPATAA